MASSHHRIRRGGQDRGFTVGDIELILHMGKNFFDESALVLYNDLNNKHVVRLKYYSFEDFDGGLEEIPNRLGDFGWNNLCQVNEILYNDQVKQFYANLRFDDDQVVSYMNNTYVTFDARVINEMFSLPNEGSDFCKPKSPFPIIDYEDLKRSYFENRRSNSLGNFKMSYFTLKHRALCHILAPIGKHKTNMTYIRLHIFMDSYGYKN